MSVERKKPPTRRSFISLETKIQILDRLKNGERTTHVAKSLKLNEATIRTIKQNEEKIRMAVTVGSSISAKMSARPRAPIIEKMEKSLGIWIADCNDKEIPLDGNIIKEKARTIYKELAENGESPVKPDFVASKGWFEKFKKRFSLQNMKIQGENVSEPMNTTIVETRPNFTLEGIWKGLNLAEQLESYFCELDPSYERSAKFQRELKKSLAPYHEIYKHLLNERREMINTEGAGDMRNTDAEKDDSDGEDHLQPKRICLVVLSSDEEEKN